MKFRFRFLPLCLLFATTVHAFEEVEPNEETLPNDVLAGNVITGNLPDFPGSERDTFRIRIHHSEPVLLSATARVTSGANPLSEVISLRLFSGAGKQVSGSASGQVSLRLGFTNLSFSPSDLFIQIQPGSGNQGERYEIVYSVRRLDKAGPQIRFGREPKAQVEKYLGPGTRSVTFQVFDRYGIQSIAVRAEGEPYRELKIQRPLLLPPKQAERTRFRFRQLRKRETIYIKAVDVAGNVTVKSHRYVRIERRVLSAPASS